MSLLRGCCAGAAVVACAVVALGSQPQVVSMSPARMSMDAAATASISITFDQPVLPASVTPASFRAFGRNSGPVSGLISFANGDKTITLTPSRPFMSGETVLVNLSHDLRAADNTPLRSAGYAYQFGVRTKPSSFAFTQVQMISNRGTPPAQTRIYGANANDFDEDGWVDMATVNEVSADVRVLLNRADGTGMFHDYLSPPPEIGVEGSPNDAADFNNDGHSDLVTGNASSSTVSILLGNGDGTFAPQQEISINSEPHGVCALDADGDGDWDIVCAARGTSRLALLTNNGAGVFSGPAYFEGGCGGEYGLMSADMDLDGILDVVVGCRDTEEIAVQRCNGNGTFSLMTVQDSGGPTWVVQVGDVNNDGQLDVSCANSFNSTGSILTGHGGTLDAPVVQPTATHCVSTDLADLDGDGDLDWVLSSFGGGEWRLYRNNGAGAFSFQQTITAIANPSCSALADIDNDGDIDLALTDEIADVLRFMVNTGCANIGDLDGDGDIDLSDLATQLASYGCTGGGCGPGDINEDGEINATDLSVLLAGFGTFCP